MRQKKQKASSGIQVSPLDRNLARIEREIILQEAEDLKVSFRKFVEEAWPIVEPGATFIPGMHIDAICEHLQAVSERKIRKLLINVQPRSGKSTIVSVLFPAWLWTHSPEERILSASYAETLSMRDAVSARRVLDSEWYKERWPHVVMMEDQNTKKVYENTLLGRRQVTSVGGATTGLGGSIKIVDDPHNVQEAESALIREAAVAWFREAWSTRSNPGGKGACSIVIMQRVHEQDVSGYCLQEGGWDHLCLPTEYEGEQRKPTSIGWQDTRTKHGELMWPELHGTEDGRAALEDLKKSLGSYGVAGQLQQRPVPRGGGTFKMEWCRFWFDPELGYPEPIRVPNKDGEPVELPQKPLPRLAPDTYLHSWDMAYKAKEKNDFVVGQVWARGYSDPANRYLIHQDRGHYDFVATKAHVQAMYDEWPSAQVLVEARANGQAVLTELANTVTGLIAIDPSYGDKVSRAASVAPTFEAGNVWLPHPAQHPWVQDFLDELAMFPKGKNDDQVDAATQALNRMRESVAVDIDAEAIIVTGARDNPWLI